MTPVELAALFHITRQQLGSLCGRQLRPEFPAVFNPASPDGLLLIAICGAIQQHLGLTPHTEGCQRCGGKRFYKFTPAFDSDILDMCLDCGQVQGKWPLEFEE